MSDSGKGLRLFMTKPAGAASPAPGLGAALAAAGPKDVKKRWMYVGGGALALVVLSATLFAPEKAVRVTREKEAGMVSVTPPSADKDAFESRFATDLQALKSQIEQVRQENERLKADQKALGESKTPPAGIVPPPVAPGTNTGGLPSLGGTDAPPPPPVPTFQVPGTSAPVSSTGTKAIPGLPGVSGVEATAVPLSFDAPARAAAEKEPLTAAAKLKLTKNPNAGVMSVGFAPVALLNGVDAGTSSMTQSNPLPVLMNLTDHATLPGAAKFQLKNCFTLGTAYGDLSAERVYVRVSRVSCVDKKNRLVLNSEVQGYLVDSDGHLGLRGLISDRQGPRLAKALLAGFAQGLAGALGQAQGTVLTNLTSGDSTSSITGGAALRASGLAGAQTATSQLAEFYLKEAQSIFPVISVDVGRVGTVVFSGPQKLEWANAEDQFVPTVTPANN